MNAQITSKGCSRSFILCVCYRALFHSSVKFANGSSVGFPFDERDILEWLHNAKEDSMDHDLQEFLGGTKIDHFDLTTYWTRPEQFQTWWKNNIERKTKNNSLRKDAQYTGDDDRHIKRARYCKGAIAICTNIRNYFERIIAKNGGEVLTVEIPFRMPAHMPIPIPPPVFQNRPRFIRKHRKRERSDNSTNHTYFDNDDDVEIEFTNSKNPYKSSKKTKTTTTLKRILYDESCDSESLMLYATNKRPPSSAYQALFPHVKPKQLQTSETYTDYFSSATTSRTHISDVDVDPMYDVSLGSSYDEIRSCSNCSKSVFSDSTSSIYAGSQVFLAGSRKSLLSGATTLPSRSTLEAIKEDSDEVSVSSASTASDTHTNNFFNNPHTSSMYDSFGFYNDDIDMNNDTYRLSFDENDSFDMFTHIEQDDVINNLASFDELNFKFTPIHPVLKSVAIGNSRNSAFDKYTKNLKIKNVQEETAMRVIDSFDDLSNLIFVSIGNNTTNFTKDYDYDKNELKTSTDTISLGDQLELMESDLISCGEYDIDTVHNADHYTGNHKMVTNSISCYIEIIDDKISSMRDDSNDN